MLFHSCLVHAQATALAPKDELVSHACCWCCFPLGTSLPKVSRAPDPSTFLGAFEVLEPVLFDPFLAMSRSHLTAVDMTALPLPCSDLLSTFNTALFSPLFRCPVYLSAVTAKLNLSNMFTLSQALVSLGLKGARYHL